MTVYYSGSTIYFTDGTSKTTAAFSWGNVTGQPTALSQFTNNILITAAGGIGTTQYSTGNCGNITSSRGVNVYQSGYTAYGQSALVNCYNCNCNCNCNC